MINLRLKQERIKKKWTQNDVAQRLGVSPQVVCDWEKGRRFPRRPLLDNLENLFGLSYRELFTSTSDSDPFSLPNNESH